MLTSFGACSLRVLVGEGIQLRFPRNHNPLAIMGSHNALAFTCGILGNVISFLVYLAPLPTFYRIYKKKSTEGFQSLPYLVALFSSMLWLYYALLKSDALLLMTINSFGCFIESIYIIMYIIYATKDVRNLTVKQFMAMNVGSFALILLITRFAVHGSLRVKVLGWICVSFAVSVFAAPLSIVARVIRTKSVEFMPFTLSFFLTLSAVMWFSYGLLIKDLVVALPNVLGFALGLLQMLLYAIYRNGGVKSQAVTVTEKKEQETNVVDGVNEQVKESVEDVEENEKNVGGNECLV